MSKSIQKSFPGANFSTVQRRYFNESKGQLYLKTLVISDLVQIVELHSNKYLALASCAAAIKYVEFIQHITLNANSLRISFSSGESAVIIDTDTAKNLELISNNRGNKKDTLFGILDFTKTGPGSRLLRSNVLQPVSDIITLNSRYDIIEELLQKENVLIQIVSDLEKFSDLDALLSQTHLISTPKNPYNAKNSALVIKNLIFFKHTLQVLPTLVSALLQCENEILLAVTRNLQHPFLQHIGEEIAKVLNDDVVYFKSLYQMRIQLSFAVKVR